MKLKRYRIVRDSYSGYGCQVWRLWFPFWVQMKYTNTSRTIEDAQTFIKERKWKMEVETKQCTMPSVGGSYVAELFRQLTANERVYIINDDYCDTCFQDEKKYDKCYCAPKYDI
jgi:hypothetical protein